MKNNYTHVIWDWNGTLLDDVDWCMRSINVTLEKRGLPTLKDTEDYRSVFGFPVIDYYRRLGFDFDKEPFELLAEEFISLYHSDDKEFRLFPDVTNALASIKEMGLRQVVLSASKLNNLRSQLELFDIEHYFDKILGISDIYAKSKTDIGISYMTEENISNAVLIGDTVHDYEVAKVIGVDCVLVANGHQTKSTLLICGVPVVDNIKNIFEFI